MQKRLKGATRMAGKSNRSQQVEGPTERFRQRHRFLVAGGWLQVQPGLLHRHAKPVGAPLAQSHEKLLPFAEIQCYRLLAEQPILHLTR